MSGNRFFQVFSCVLFDDKESCNQFQIDEKLAPVREVLGMFRTDVRLAYTP
jgi:hypothetical protein